jgi:phage-related tail fiber protein
MAQADQSVQNATFPTVRADINSNLAALFSANSGSTAPSTTVAFQDWIDTSGSDAVWKKRNAANNAWITIGTFAGAELSLGGTVPAGSIQYFAGSSAPDGYLKANGATISRTTYADLFTAIGTSFGVGDGSTTFTLPDLRAEFIRGWDDGRGIDSGRTFGTAQAASRIGFYAAYGGDVDVINPDQFFSTTRSKVNSNNTVTTTSNDSSVRPRNIALLAIIKF